MAIKLSTETRNAVCNAAVDRLDGGRVEIRTGSRPANPQAAATGTLIGTLTLPDPAFGDAVTGTATANAVTPGSASGSGVATWFRAYRSAGNGGGAVLDGDVGEAAEDMVVQNTDINAGQALSVTSWTHTQPE